MTAAVQVRNLRRWFGAVRAVDGLSFSLPAGSVTGFIGANGAGKTTTLRILATLDQQDSGTACIDGLDTRIDSMEVRRRVGWMPDAVPVFDATDVLAYLDFFARAYGLAGAARRARLEEVIQFTELAELLERPVKGLSKGQLQRLSLARTLLHDPSLLILDEPAAGLDPKARIEFRNLVQILRAQGKTLLISSHILSELGELCDRLLFIESGKLLFEGTPAELQQRGFTGAAPATGVEAGSNQPGQAALQPVAVIELRSTIGRQALERILLERPGWKLEGHTVHGVRARFEDGTPSRLEAELEALLRSGVPLHHFGCIEQKLEDVFVEALKNRGSGGRQP